MTTVNVKGSVNASREAVVSTNVNAANTIDLWLAYYQDWDGDCAQDRLQALLSDDEKRQRERFYFADDRLRYAVTRAMVRTVLARYAAVAPVDWRFVANAYGRPAIAPQHGAACELNFNVSHTRGLIVLGITRLGMLGIDVESLHRAAAPGLAERMFSARESTDLRRTPLQERDFRFYEYWTFKESYIKARGMGLSLPLDKFSFSFPDAGAVKLDIDAELADVPDRWRLWQFQPTADYLLAVCAESQGDHPQSVRLRKLTPRDDDEELALTPRRRTEP